MFVLCQTKMQVDQEGQSQGDQQTDENSPSNKVSSDEYLYISMIYAILYFY